MNASSTATPLVELAAAMAEAPRPASLRRGRTVLMLALGLSIGFGALVATSFGVDLGTLFRSEAKVAPVRTLEISRKEQQDLIASTKSPLAAPVAEGEAAKTINAALPFSTAPVQAASPFSLAAVGDDVRQRALRCLTQAIYYEAGFEPVEGRRAVAQVVLNRMRHPAFPKSVCGVVYEGATAPVCQFSFTCDGSLRRTPARGAWLAAESIAREALAGRVAASVGQATHYHTDYVAPYWAPKLAKIQQIGAHIFYRWPGSWGQKGAFTGRYAGSEPSTDGLATVTEPDAAADTPVIVQAPDDRRAPNDIGGRLDPTKGWTLSIPAPSESSSAFRRLAAAQQPTQLAAASPVHGAPPQAAQDGNGGTQ